MTTAPFRYAGFWIRVAARVIDLALILAAFNLFFLVDRFGARAGLWAPAAIMGGGGPFSAGNAIRFVFFLFFPAFYYVYLHGAFGQTFGKMALGLRVLNHEGSPLTFGTSFLRWLGYFLCDLTLDIGYLWVAFDARKQGLHDKLCGTVVVRDDPGTP